jgi:hypothetical protein
LPPPRGSIALSDRLRRFYYTAAASFEKEGSINWIPENGISEVGGEMSRTTDKIAHLRKTAFEHPESIDVLLPFEEIFALDLPAGKERFERGK